MKIIIFAITFLYLTACNDKNTYSIQYLMKHKKTLFKIVSQCQKLREVTYYDEATKKQCINASIALTNIDAREKGESNIFTFN